MSNDEALNELRAKVSKQSAEENADLLAQALFYLRCVCGSRNSFGPINGLGFPERSPAVEKMHHEAAAFLRHHDV